ncbi:nucleoside deaminase [Methylobacterium trifolii]|uniref:tRNA-specific adenosine deaminase n=1 Tax=Methylobacterium trifolii TaxID=1003092 RepID=A0ABQ4U0G5_9HYPH|nr:nucleoside deaminase [Methylobacterium trifolii]GJE60483.1 tRNA-specific adenosine deaminase [Methylobacterium trifolii]
MPDPIQTAARETRDASRETRDAARDIEAGAQECDPFDRAFAAARQAAGEGEVPVGAAIVRGGAVIAVAHNRPRALHDPTAHAEILAIRAACGILQDERLPGCDLYVTLEPCPMCAGAISFARIRRLYFGASDPKGGGVEHGPRIFNQPTCHHAPEVYGGFREGEAAGLLRAFFESRRP